MAFYSSQCLVIINYSVLLSFWHTLEHISKGLNEEATNSGASVRFAGRSLIQPTASPWSFSWERRSVDPALNPVHCAQHCLSLSLFITFFFFWVFIEFVTILLVLCFGSCGILAPQAGSEPSPPALQEVLTTGPPGKPWLPFSLMQLCRGEQRPCFELLVKWGRMVPRHCPAINHTESHGCIEPGLSRSPPAPCKLMLYNLGLAASCLWTTQL